MTQKDRIESLLLVVEKMIEKSEELRDAVKSGEKQSFNIYLELLDSKNKAKNAISGIRSILK